MEALLVPALVCVALGLTLAAATKRTQWQCIVLLGAVAGMTTMVPFPPDWKDAALIAGWVSVMMTAVSVLVPMQLPDWLVLSLAVNAGFWTGALIALTAQPADLVLALLLVFIVLPARWVLTKPLHLGVKIIAGWLVAVAILGAGVSMLPTPGYKSDHME